MNTASKLINCIRGGYACIQVLSPEEDRVAELITAAAKTLQYEVWSWTITVGLMDETGHVIDKTGDPLNALLQFNQVAVNKATNEPVGSVVHNKSIVMLRDFHLLLKSNAPPLIRRVKEAISIGRATNRHLVIIGCQLHLPAELEKEITVITLPMPGRDELTGIAKNMAAAVTPPQAFNNGDLDEIVDSMSGLTMVEAENAAASSIVENKKLDAAFIAEVKAEQLKKGGLLELVKSDISFNDLGGLNELKSWLGKRIHAFTQKARDYGLPMPKGVCMFGVQGAGKSFATKAIAHELNCPLLKLDAGKLFSSLVGSSEGNVRSVINQVEAFGKCVLQIDEIDKGFAGMTSSHDGDSGTTRRVIGTFLSWMQDKTCPVFIVATANDLTKLPPELLRKGRWDELFFIDLPTPLERNEIWAIQIRRHKRKPEDFDITRLSAATEGWTGAEIESLFVESMYNAFASGTEPTTELLLNLSKQTVPLSKTMEERITALRKWASTRARSASKVGV